MENITYYLLKDTKIERLGIDVGLEALQEAVGGYIESIYPCGEYKVAYCNEEGKLQGLKTNVLASGLLNKVIVGPVVLGMMGNKTWMPSQ